MLEIFTTEGLTALAQVIAIDLVLADAGLGQRLARCVGGQRERALARHAADGRNAGADDRGFTAETARR